MLTKYIIALATVSCVICPTPILKAKTSEPFLISKPSVIDIGKQIVGQIVETESVIYNTGTKSISIKKFVYSCNCLDIQPSSEVIAPGKSIKLSVKIDGPAHEGEFKKSFWVLTNEQSNPIYKISIVGDFIALDHQLLAYPEIVECGSVVSGSKVSQAIQIRRNGGVPIGQINISSPKSWIEVKHESEDERNLRLYVTVTAPNSIFDINESIFVRGSDKDDFVRIPVKGIVSSRVEVSPQFVLVEPDKIEYVILIKQYNGTKSKYIDHEFEGDGLNLLSCDIESGKIEQLVVKIKRQHLHKGFASGKLSLKFNGEPQPIDIVFVSPDALENEMSM